MTAEVSKTRDPLVNVFVCAWMLGGHRWRLLARWDWNAARRVVVGERCSRCWLTRPVGGYFAARRRDFTLASGGPS